MARKSRNRPRAERLPLRCRIVHSNGQISEVNPNEFCENLKQGNLIQSLSQRRAARFLAYVLPGLVAYRAVQTTTLKADDRPGSMLVFEAADRITQLEIAERLIDEFEFTPENAALIATAIIQSRQRSSRPLFGGPRAGNVWEGLYLSHMLRSVRTGFISKDELVRCRQNCEPLLLGEPVIAGDPSTAFALW